MYQLSLLGPSSLSTSSAAGSRVKTSARPAEARALRAAARVYGERCFGLSAKCDPLGSSLRTYLRSACEVLTGLSLRWKESVTPAGHWWLALGRSVRRTSEIGCGSSDTWQTPSAGCAEAGATSRSGKRKEELLLGGQVRQWPTPRGADSERGPDYGATENHDGGGNLRAACNWPTAAATHSEGKGDLVQAIRGNPNSHYKSVGRPAPESPSMIGKPRGSLNSAWVMQLMGWPEDYAAELTRLCLEWQETAGAIRSRCSSTIGS